MMMDMLFMVKLSLVSYCETFLPKVNVSCVHMSFPAGTGGGQHV